MNQQPGIQLIFWSFNLKFYKKLHFLKQEFSKFSIFLLVPILISFIPFCKCKEHKRISLTFDPTTFAPDGFRVPGISINGQSPGETLIFQSHESYEIEVVNNLDHGLTLHLHGLHFKGANEFDGVPFVTQNPIREQSSFLYKVNTGNQSGTFIYHAHTRLDIQWAYGALIIDDKWKIGNVQDYYYDKECVVFISQLFHADMETVMKELVGKPFKYVPRAKSLLIQAPSCSVPTTETQNKYPILSVNPGETIRFRVIGMGMDSMLSFRIANHTLKVIEADQIPVEPVTTNFLWVNSAQRYSVIVKMDQPVGNYLIETEMVPKDGPNNGLGVLHYEGALDTKDMANLKRDTEAHTPKKKLHRWILDNLRPSTKIQNPDVYPVPFDIDRELIITSFQRDVHGFQKFDINDVVHKKPDLPLLEQLKIGQNISENKENGVYEILIGEKVQIVFQNTMSDEALCEQHPWHIHGHTFYVVGAGANAYDPKMDGQMIENNIKSKNGAFQFRDVVTVFPNQTKRDTSNRAPCGWTAVRFVADNPGLWVCHCHLQAHHIMGKYFTLYAHEKLREAKITGPNGLCFPRSMDQGLGKFDHSLSKLFEQINNLKNEQGKINDQITALKKRVDEIPPQIKKLHTAEKMRHVIIIGLIDAEKETEVMLLKKITKVFKILQLPLSVVDTVERIVSISNPRPRPVLVRCKNVSYRRKILNNVGFLNSDRYTQNIQIIEDF